MNRKSQGDYDTAAFLREAFECLPNGFCIFDRDFRPLVTNRIARDAFNDFFAGMARGLSYREAHFAEARYALPNATDSERWQIADRIVVHARAGASIDLRTRDGRSFSAIYHVMSGGRCAAVYIDMTESHQRATEFEALQGKIQAANRTKSVFLAKLSHAMRTPLTGILGMAQILADGRLAPDDREQVEIILESGNFLIALLEEALNLSQIEAGQMQFTPTNGDLEQIIRRQFGLAMRGAKENGTRLKLQIAPGLPALSFFDPSLFGQCLSHLIPRAIKLNKRGVVRITVTSRDVQNKFIINIAISATSTGTKPETAVERSLVIVRKLAQLMVGDLRITSEADKGSTLALTLTVEAVRIGQRPDTTVLTQPLSSATTREVMRGKRILLVDDHLINRRVARLFLEPAACEIVEAENGLEALTELEKGAFDLVLLDICMPVLDGLETLKRIRASRKLWSNVPVIALTANAMGGDRERYLAEGMDGYVSKPINKQTLFAEMARLLRQMFAPRTEDGGRLDLLALAGQFTPRGPLPPNSVSNPALGDGRLDHTKHSQASGRSVSPNIKPNPVEEAIGSQLNDFEIALLLQEAVEVLHNGFSVFDDKMRIIMSNRLSRETFAEYYTAMEKGSSGREAMLSCVRRAMPLVSDEECRRTVGKIEAHIYSGKPIELVTDSGIYRTTCHKLSHDRYLAVSVDIAEERKRKKEIATARRQANAPDQGNSTFLADMRHEMRTPLNSLLGMAYVLMQCPLTPTQMEQAGAILGSGKSLKTLFDDLLDLSKMEA